MAYGKGNFCWVPVLAEAHLCLHSKGGSSRILNELVVGKNP